jgi:POT family proton-dependent oligopeptide transporter
MFASNAAETQGSKQKLNPKWFLLICLQEVGVGLLFSMAILYYTHSLHFTTLAAINLNTAFFILYSTGPLIGGLLGDNYLGYAKTLKLGLFLAFLGYLLLLLGTIALLCFSLALIALGSGCFRPNVWCLLGEERNVNHQQRANLLTNNYTGLAIGGLVATFLGGLWIQFASYKSVFILSTITLLCALVAFSFYKEAQTKKLTLNNLLGLLIIVAALLIFTLGLQYPEVCQKTVFLLALMVTFWVIYSLRQYAVKCLKLLSTIFIINIIGVVFWCSATLFQEIVTIYSINHVQRVIVGFTIPTASIIAIWYLAMCLFAPLISRLWQLSENFNKQINVLQKLGVGVLIIALASLTIPVAMNIAFSDGKIPVSYIALLYGLIGLSEVIIIPIGYAALYRLVPKQLRSFLLGVWAFTDAVGVAISKTYIHHGLAGKLMTLSKANSITFYNFFLEFSTLIALVFVIILILNFFLKRKKSSTTVLHEILH